MSEVMEQANREIPVMGPIPYADDFMVSSDGGKADCVWDETTGALAEICRRKGRLCVGRDDGCTG